MAPNYRSLVPGGYFSSTPFDRTIPVSIRCNNPGAINGAAWEERYPGYVQTVETTPGNKTTIFETPEHGVAVWWELLRRYAATNAKTVGQIVNKYGGGQDYSNYIKFVAANSGLAEHQEVSLDDDAVLLAFGKAMFHYEAGRPTPLQDQQISYGLQIGRSDGVLAEADVNQNVFALADVTVKGSEFDLLSENLNTAASETALLEQLLEDSENCLIYEQSSGRMSVRVLGAYDLLGTGYSGSKADGGYNDPRKQCVSKVGPIPRGRYEVGAPQSRPSIYSLPLTPSAGTDTCGRSGFFIHGDSISKPGTASEGCIILSRNERESIMKTGVKSLLVVDHITS